MQPFLAAFLFPKTKDKLLCPNNIHKMYCLFWAQDTNFKAIHNGENVQFFSAAKLLIFLISCSVFSEKIFLPKNLDVLRFCRTFARKINSFIVWVIPLEI